MLRQIIVELNILPWSMRALTWWVYQYNIIFFISFFDFQKSSCSVFNFVMLSFLAYFELVHWSFEHSKKNLRHLLGLVRSANDFSAPVKWGICALHFRLWHDVPGQGMACLYAPIIMDRCHLWTIKAMSDFLIRSNKWGIIQSKLAPMSFVEMIFLKKLNRTSYD